MFRFLLTSIFGLGLLLSSPLLRAADLNTITGLQVQNGAVTVEFSENPGVYYLLEHSPDLIQWARTGGHEPRH